MSTHQHFDKICCVILTLTLVLTILFMNAESMGISKASAAPGYETRLFDTSKVHTVNIIMDGWDSFIDSCTDEEYAQCSVIIDNEAYQNVAIRAKGNTSLSNVQNYGNDRYSFKIEFDHYDGTNTYYGLDKLSLNNLIQDNTCMKDYLTYQMMGSFGVSAPLCSYVQIFVNGKEWGLYLAVEGVEESFLSRNYGDDYGQLYKPDSMSMGGGRGNGGAFDMEDWKDRQGQEEGMEPPAGLEPETMGAGQFPPGRMAPPDGNGAMGAMNSTDVALIYADEEYASYSNIFDHAKTDISDADKDRLIASLKKLNENSDLENVVNREEVIRYFVVHNFVCNFDSYTGSMIHNYYLYEEEGQLSMIPWDYNLAFGGFTGSSDATSLVNYPIDTPVSGGTIESRPMLSWIFESEADTALYHQYFAEFLSQYFDSGAVAAMIDRVKNLISPYVESDPTKFCTYEEFEKGIDTLKEFCLLRAESVNAQLSGTIASTTDGQERETLVDASGLSISAMGGMGRGWGQEMDTKGPDTGSGNHQPMPQTPEGQTQTQGENTPPAEDGGTQAQPPGGGDGMPQLPQDGETPNFPQNGEMSNVPQGGDGQERTPPEINGGPGEEPSGAPSSSGLLLLGGCAVVLLAGLLFARLYKKRT